MARLLKKTKAMSAKDLFNDIREKAEKTSKKFEKDGLCIACGEDSGNPQTYKCDSCEIETERLLKQLRGPGFAEFKVKD